MHYKTSVDKHFDWPWNGLKIPHILHRTYSGAAFLVYATAKALLFAIKSPNPK